MKTMTKIAVGRKVRFGKRTGVVLAQAQDVYLVRPDDGKAPTMAMPNGEVFQALEVKAERLEAQSVGGVV